MKKTLIEIQKLLDELTNRVENLEERTKVPRKEPDWPQYGDDIYILDADGEVMEESFIEKYWYHENIMSQGNLFRTEEEAEAEAKRRESIAKRGEMPGKGEYIWYWNFNDKKPVALYFDYNFLPEYYIGNTHKTKEEAQQWYKEYGVFFEKLMK